MKNKKTWNVLVFPGGTENGLEINRSLRYAKEVKLFSVSSNVKNHAEYMYLNHFIIPEIKEANCLSELNQILLNNKIDFIIPANSLIIDFLIKNRDKIKSKVIQPENNIVELIRSKKKTYTLFKDKLSVPIVYTKINTNTPFPIFLKPDSMYGSQGIKKIDTLEEFNSLTVNLKDFIVTEFLPGDEFSIECFSSRKLGLIYCSARTRERIRMGTSMHSELANSTVQNDALNMAKTIFNTLKIEGLWFFQIKYNSKNKLTLLEIESRVAGTMAFSRNLGANLPLANLYLEDKQEIKIHTQKYDLVIDRSLGNRYKTNIMYDTVYLDLDDTIIIKGKINTDIMKFIYQCINKKIKLILISKSTEENKEKYLKKYKLENLFDEIFWIEENKSKANYITNKNSIFIDDSFSQRLEVEDKHGIPTFEPNMIEVLIDDRNE